MATLRQRTSFGPGIYRNHKFTKERLMRFAEGTNKAIAAGVPVPLLRRHASIGADDEATMAAATLEGAGWISKLDVDPDGHLAWEAKDVPEDVVKAVEGGQIRFTSPEFRDCYTCEKADLDGKPVYEGPIVRHIATVFKPGNPHQGAIEVGSPAEMSPDDVQQKAGEVALAMEELHPGVFQFDESERQPIDSQHAEDEDSTPGTVSLSRHHKDLKKKGYKFSGTSNNGWTAHYNHPSGRSARIEWQSGADQHGSVHHGTKSQHEEETQHAEFSLDRRDESFKGSGNFPKATADAADDSTHDTPKLAGGEGESIDKDSLISENEEEDKTKKKKKKEEEEVSQHAEGERKANPDDPRIMRSRFLKEHSSKDFAHGSYGPPAGHGGPHTTEAFHDLVAKHGGSSDSRGGFAVPHSKVDEFHKAALKKGYAHGTHYNMASQHAEVIKNAPNPYSRMDNENEKAEVTNAPDIIDPESPPPTDIPPEMNPDMPPKATDKSKEQAAIAGLNQMGLVLPSDFCFADEGAIDVLLAAVNTHIAGENKREAEEQAEPEEESPPVQEAAMPFNEQFSEKDYLALVKKHGGKVVVPKDNLAAFNAELPKPETTQFTEEEIAALPEKVRKAIQFAEEQRRAAEKAQAENAAKALQLAEQEQLAFAEASRKEAKETVMQSRIPPALKKRLVEGIDEFSTVQFGEEQFSEDSHRGLYQVSADTEERHNQFEKLVGEHGGRFIRGKNRSMFSIPKKNTKDFHTKAAAGKFGNVHYRMASGKGYVGAHSEEQPLYSAQEVAHMVSQVLPPWMAFSEVGVLEADTEALGKQFFDKSDTPGHVSDSRAEELVKDSPVLKGVQSSSAIKSITDFVTDQNERNPNRVMSPTVPDFEHPFG